LYGEDEVEETNATIDEEGRDGFMEMKSGR